MRRWFVALLVLMLSLTGAAGALAGNHQSADGHRILLNGDSARAAGLAVRHTFGLDRVTAHVTDVQLRALSRLGVAFELVPVRSIQAPPPGKGPGGGGSTRAIPSTQVPYGIKMAHGDPALSPTGISGGAGILVAVLDTGSVDHADFTRSDGSRVVTDCADFSSRKADFIQDSCADGHGHGTHVTGTVAAAGGSDGKGIFGVAPQASVLSYKVMTDNGRGYADDIARAIRYAADKGANIISMSLGSSSPSSLERDAIQYAVSKGVLVVAAAGNSGPSADTIGYPAAFPEVVAVASLNPDEVVSYFSSRGLTDGDDTTIVEREVEVSAAGRRVISTYKDGAYYTMSGTSMATPHVAGLAAKMWQGSAGATRNWLRTSAKAHDITVAEDNNNAGAGYDIAAGYGVPQVNAMVQALWTD